MLLVPELKVPEGIGLAGIVPLPGDLCEIVSNVCNIVQGIANN